MNLTRCQRDVYQALAALIGAGRRPTRRAIAQMARCHPVTVSRCLRSLEALGLVIVQPCNGDCPQYKIKGAYETANAAAAQTA